MIMQLRHRPYGRSGSLNGAALIDGDGGGDSLDRFDVGLVHALEKLARVRGETLDVAPLTFSIEDVKRERRLSRAADSGDHREGIERKVEVDVLQIVLLSAPDVYRVLAHDGSLLLAHARRSRTRTTNTFVGHLIADGISRPRFGAGGSRRSNRKFSPFWGKAPEPFLLYWR